MNFHMHSSGIIQTPFTDRDKMPIQAARAQAADSDEGLPEYVEDLRDLDGFSHILPIFGMPLLVSNCW